MNEYKEVMRMTPRRRKKTQIIITCFSLVVLLFVVYQIFSNTNSIWKRHNVKEYDLQSLFLDGYDSSGIFSLVLKQQNPFPFQGEKLIHLDLKGAPPVVAYYKKFFPYIKALGATGVLIEYEDMFYYKDDLADIRAHNAYTPGEIKAILKLAYSNGLEVIPLVQTFGHLEFVLKLEKFRDLREVDAFPQVLCPSHERVQSVIQRMIDQVIKAHPKINYIHIGSDEVMYLGKCSKCRAMLDKNSWTNSDLYLNHVKSVASYINKTYPGIRPIVWSDLLQKMNAKVLEKSQISSFVDLMVWKYAPNVNDYITNDMLKMFSKVFKNIWIASAFKGATGANQMIANPKYHLANHMAWMDIVFKWKDVINFKGIALTGWQRYDHFAMLCELLPVAIPSLTLSMNYLSGFENGLNEESISKILQCESPFTISLDRDSNSSNKKCEFPGYLVHQLVNKFYIFSSRIGSHLSLTSSAWFSLYNIVHRFSSPTYVKGIFENWPVEEYLKGITELQEDLKRALSEVYDEHTVKEWIMTHVAPIKIRLEALYIAKESVLQQKTWPRRPLVNNSDGLERAAREICTFDRPFGCAALLL